MPASCCRIPDSQIVLARVGDDVAFGCENLGVPPTRSGAASARRSTPSGSACRSTTRRQPSRAARRSVSPWPACSRCVPGLILLDEPTANLDPEGVHEVRDAVARVADETGATLVVIEHRVSVWLPVVDRVVVLGPTAA